MSREQAKNIFKANQTKWQEKTMHDFTDVVFNEIDKNKNEVKDFIVDYGSNSNSYWEKWKSGKLVMYGVNKQTVTTSDKAGAIYFAAAQKTRFPIPCVNSNYIVQATSETTTGLNWIGINNNGCKLDGVTFRIFGAINLERVYNIRWLVIGRWK